MENCYVRHHDAGRVEEGHLPHYELPYHLWPQKELEDFFASQQWNMDGWAQEELELHCKIHNFARGFTSGEAKLENTCTRPEGVCGRWAWFSEEGKLVRFFCGGRKCHRSQCKKTFAWRRVRLLTDLVREHELRYFYTLTLDPKNFKDDSDAWHRIPKVWNKFLTVIRRKYGGFKFASVLEKHRRNGRPHIHGFTNEFIDWAVWRHHWEACGGGNGVWLEKVQHEQSLSQYVAKSIDVCKYVAKDALHSVPDDVRRTFWRSTGLHTEKELTKGTAWSIIKKDVFNSSGEQIIKIGDCDNGNELAETPCTLHACGNEVRNSKGKENLER